MIQLISNKPILNDSFKLLIKDSITPYYLSLSKDTITTYFQPTSDTTAINIYSTSDTFEFEYILDINNLKYTPRISASATDSTLYIKSNTPLKRLGEADEVAKAVTSILENDFLNGVILDVNGGLTI
mgnify:CR=1 FL=1